MLLGNERGGLSLFLGTANNINAVVQNDEHDFSPKLYPNPCGNNLYLEESENFNYRIYSLLGQELLTGFSEDGEIVVSSLKKGIYIIKVDNNFNSFSSRFIKL